jgi:hypothetical protein
VYSTIGAAMPPVVAIAWMWAEGVLLDAWIALAEYNRAYLAVGGNSVADIVMQFAREVWRRVRSDDVWAFGSLSAAVALGAWRWRKTRPGLVAALGIAWLAASLVAVVANGPRLFTTYFVPPRVPLCLLIAWLLDRTLASSPGVRPRWRIAAGVAVIVVSAAMIVRSGSFERAVTMTSWDAKYLFGRIDREAYLQMFRSRDGRAFSSADNARVAEYVRAHTEPGERIFVFGMTAGTYFLSGRLPASRFLFVYPAVSNMIDRPEFRVESLAAELARTRPRYIVLQRYNRDSFSGWRAEDSFAAPPMAALLAEYEQEAEVGNFVLYRRP